MDFEKEKKFIELDIFEIYKTESVDYFPSKISIKDILSFDKLKLNNTIFKYVEEFQQKEKYFNVKLNQMTGKN